VRTTDVRPSSDGITFPLTNFLTNTDEKMSRKKDNKPKQFYVFHKSPDEFLWQIKASTESVIMTDSVDFLVTISRMVPDCC
jgi:hypothetical protein